MKPAAKIDFENIPQDMRECVHSLADAGRDTKRIWAVTGIPAGVIYRILLDREGT